jgi:hypothetical protein
LFAVFKHGYGTLGITKTLFQDENKGKNRARLYCERMAFLLTDTCSNSHADCLLSFLTFSSPISGAILAGL